MTFLARLRAPLLPARLFSLLVAVLCLAWYVYGAQTKPSGDPLGRETPRSAVKNFLKTCHSDDYQRASQYLDLRQLATKTRAQKGAQLAQNLEAILNSDSQFDILRVSQQPQGNLADQNNPAIEQVAVVVQNDRSFPIDLERVELQANQQVWLFSAPTVAEIPELTVNTATSAIEAHLPHFLVRTMLLETP